MVFLRSVGLLNTGVWLGAAVFYTFAAGPAMASREMEDLLGARNYPYFAVAIAQILGWRYFHLQLVCSVVAVLHMLAEWLYLGKVPGRLWRGLLVALLAVNLAGGFWLQPRLKSWHHLTYALNTPGETRKSAARAFRAWQGVAEMVNFLMVGGLGVYLWRLANPPDPTRYVSTTKFRS